MLPPSPLFYAWPSSDSRLTIRVQTGLRRSASTRLTDEADHVLRTSYHARYFVRQASDQS
jgi:hypothetical protein